MGSPASGNPLDAMLPGYMPVIRGTAYNAETYELYGQDQAQSWSTLSFPNIFLREVSGGYSDLDNPKNSVWHSIELDARLRADLYSILGPRITGRVLLNIGLNDNGVRQNLPKHLSLIHI